MSALAASYFAPVTKKLRADGAMKVIGFGQALGNRFVRLAETHASLFDSVVVISAGDTFSGFAPGTEAATLDADWRNASLTDDVRFTAWRNLYMGPKYRHVEIEGGFNRATDTCMGAMLPFFPQPFGTPSIYPREEWTTLGGDKPLLVVGGSNDRHAPIATNGQAYKDFSPDTVTLVVLEGAGHVIQWEAPEKVVAETRKWLGLDLMCKPWCNYWTCSMDSCVDCDVVMPDECGHKPGTVCLDWCNAHTCADVHCTGCDVCAEVKAGEHCAKWCNAYTCDDDFCSGCKVCDDLEQGKHCSDWCNKYTCPSSIFGNFITCSGCDFC